MKAIKKLLLNVMLVTFMLVLSGMTVSAATTTKNLGQNKWVTQTGKGDSIYYKITIPQDGYITFTVKNPKKNNIYIDVYNKNKVYMDMPVYTKASNETVQYPVAKGTYYLRGDNWDSFQFKYKFTKVTGKTNYCAAKAVKLKKNSNVTIVQTPQKHYDRWYKITLTKKQKINYWFTGQGSVELYDADFNMISVNSGSKGKYTTKQTQNKGTYYVGIRSYYSVRAARMCTFKWN